MGKINGIYISSIVCARKHKFLNLYSVTLAGIVSDLIGVYSMVGKKTIFRNYTND